MQNIAFANCDSHSRQINYKISKYFFTNTHNRPVVWNKKFLNKFGKRNWSIWLTAIVRDALMKSSC